MNPYKAAIKIVQHVLSDDCMPLSARDLIGAATRKLVKTILDETFDEIDAEDNGLSDTQILNANQFVFEQSGLTGHLACNACPEDAAVHMLVTRADTEETKEVYACKAHMLDPGPLLDW